MSTADFVEAMETADPYNGQLSLTPEHIVDVRQAIENTLNIQNYSLFSLSEGVMSDVDQRAITDYVLTSPMEIFMELETRFVFSAQTLSPIEDVMSRGSEFRERWFVGPALEALDKGGKERKCQRRIFVRKLILLSAKLLRYIRMLYPEHKYISMALLKSG